MWLLSLATQMQQLRLGTLGLNALKKKINLITEIQGYQLMCITRTFVSPGASSRNKCSLQSYKTLSAVYDWLALAAITWSKCFLYDFISLTLLLRNFDPLFFTTLLQFIEVFKYWCLFRLSSLKVSTHHFNWLEVCTLTGPLQQLDYFHFQPFG